MSMTTSVCQKRFFAIICRWNGQCHEIFVTNYFMSPGLLIIPSALFWISYKIREDIRNSRLTIGVNETGHGLLNGNSDTSGHTFSCQHIPVAWTKYSQSCWYFRPLLWTSAPLIFSLVSGHIPPHSPPCLKTSTGVCNHAVCSRGGGWIRGLRQIKTCRQVPVRVNF